MLPLYFKRPAACSYAAKGLGKGHVAPAEKLLEVQRAALFAREPGEVMIGRLSLRAHAAKPGGVQVKCTGHVYM